MNLTTRSLVPGQRSLPADLRGGHHGRHRLSVSADVMQGHGGMGQLHPWRPLMPTDPYNAGGSGPLLYTGPTVLNDIPPGGWPVSNTLPVGFVNPFSPRRIGLGQTCANPDPAGLCPGDPNFGIDPGTGLPYNTQIPVTLPSMISPTAMPATQIDPTTGLPISQISAAAGSPIYQTAPGNSTPTTAPAGYQWASVLNAAGNTLLKIMVASTPGAGMTTLPNGMQVVYGAGGGSGASVLTSTFGSASLTGMMPYLMIGGGVLLLLMLTGGRR